MEGLTVWVFRHRGFPGRGQGAPETGVDMTKVGGSVFKHRLPDEHTGNMTQ